MTNTALNTQLNEWYEQNMYDPYNREFCGGDDFFNFGYWTKSTTNVQTAQEHMMSLLIRNFSNPSAILDVACGRGGTTSFLSRTFPEASITGIDISKKQLRSCAEKVPECRFEFMDAVSMTFEDSSFDAVVSVEAAFHFDTRKDFLAEAYRVLRPGGWLSLADILMEIGDDSYLDSMGIKIGGPEEQGPHPKGNPIKSFEDYREALLGEGFSAIEIVDMTQECTGGFVAYAREYHSKKLANNELSQELYTEKIDAADWLEKVCRPYVRVCARK
jgi:MPBQ/MSBQ methyltransferase